MWQKPSTTASPACPRYVPVHSGKGAAGRIWGSPISCEVSCQLGLQARRGSDPLQAPWHRAQPGRESWVLPEMLTWRWWGEVQEPSHKLSRWCPAWGCISSFKPVKPALCARSSNPASPRLPCLLCARTGVSESFQWTRWVKWSACKVPW